jgi:hypothetical protein
MIRKFFARLMPSIMLVALAFAGSVFAQSGGTGSISGTVTDATGAIVRGASVTLTNKATNQTSTVTTGDNGLFNFALLQPGSYSVRTTAPSFGEQTTDVSVFVGRTTDVPVTLTTGEVTAVVEVSGESIQTTINNFDAVQNEAAIQNLPINGRRFQDFVTLTPSAQVDPSRGQISLSGQRGINTNVSVDGVDYNQPFFGGIRGGERSNSAFTLPQEAIREFQVVAAGYSAEFGRSSGGIVNVVTRSGSNDVRGSLFYLLRPQRLARANDFAKELGVQRLNALGIDATLAPTQQQFGGSIGGPVVKNRLFYFATAEVQRFKAPRQVLFQNLVGIAPSNLTNAAAQTASYNFYRSLEVPYEATNDAIALLGKMDWNINDANRFSIRYNHSRNKALNAVATGETALDPTTTNSLSTNGTEENRNNIVVAQFVSNLSSNWINEFRGQFAREERPRTANEVVSNVTTAIGIYGTRNFLPTSQFDRRMQVGNNLTYLSGAHTVKMGAEFSDIFADQTFGFNQTGVYTFAGLTSTLGTGVVGTGLLDATGTTTSATFRGRFDTTTARYNKQIGNLSAAYGVKELSFFIQDAWRIRRNFTLNMGLRYEKQFNPDAQATNTPVIDAVKAATFPLLGKSIDPTVIPDSQNQWGPRLGFAWDPKGNGKTVVRAFTGMYYARTPLIVLAGPYNNFRNPPGDLSVTLGAPALTGTRTGTGGNNRFDVLTFLAANPQYTAITGITAAGCADAATNQTTFNNCAPNTVFRQFAIAGVNLNSSPLTNLPQLSPVQLQSITNAILGATVNPPANLGVFQNANLTGMTSAFRNPQSFQFGGGVEHEMWTGVILGLDYSQVNTSYLQRNRDVNLPAPTGIDPVTGRVLVNRNSGRPVSSLGTIQIRDSSARSLYRGLTFRMNMNQRWMRLNAFYTLSRNVSDDDNERDAGGVLYSNPYNLKGEYYNSRLDRRHQFVANPLFYMPWKFELSSAIRIRSGNPVNSLIGSDANGDNNNTDRPMIVPGVELPRNFFTNRSTYDIDLRVQRPISFGENRRLTLSAEFFNVLNRSNVQFAGSATTNYCSNTASNCGLAGITNINHLNIIQQNPSATNFGRLNIGGLNPGSQVFQMQLGARFYF